MELIISEVDRLSQLEIIIDGGLKTFVTVGTALLEIRDSRLYRAEYRTFEEYCRQRWGLERSRAYRLMDAAEVVENVANWRHILPATESQARPLASLDPEQQVEAWGIAVDTAPNGKITAEHVQNVVDDYEFNRQQIIEANRQGAAIIVPPEKRPVSYHVSDDSYEWYTPVEYIEAARLVMNGIDLDPASSQQAQKIINAEVYYTKDTDGLSQPWFGNVWLNPPYNMPLIDQFITTAIDYYLSGAIKSAIILTNNSSDTGWFHKLIDYPVCFTRGRIQFWNGDDKLATRQGQAIFYLGNNSDKFAEVFSSFGAVLKRYDN